MLSFIPEARARIHAALGDPARLAIVDALTLGDASPGEIAHDLGMPTNLVAHHVKVLTEAAGRARAGPRATGAAPTCGCGPRPWPR